MDGTRRRRRAELFGHVISRKPHREENKKMGFFVRLFGKKPQAETETPPPNEAAAPDEAQTRADALIAEGNALEEAGQIEAALGKYQQALDAAPDY